AAQINATKCLTWLSGSGPLKAYTEYMTTSKDDRAISLKRMKDFEQRLPILLGATPTRLGEHVVFAHLHGGAAKKETLMHLFDIFVRDTTVFIHKKLEGIEVTPLLYICGQNLSKDIFDFFFERGADVLSSTSDRGCLDLMKHVFARLSQDQLSILLSQTTRRKSNTPLMIAIKAGNLGVVEFLLSFHHPVTDASLLVRDANGSLPIHEATSKGYHKIVELLVRSKSAQAMKALCTENGIGSTPLEIAAFKHLLGFDRELQSRFDGAAALPYTVPSLVVTNRLSGPWTSARALLDSLKQMLDQLPQINRITIEEYQALENIVVSLDEEGRFTNSPILQRVLREYVERAASALEDHNGNSAQKALVDEELKAVYSSAESNPSVGYAGPKMPFVQNVVASQDIKATYEMIRNAIESSGLKRRRVLVHLLDAQKAVNSAMAVATQAGHFGFGQAPGYFGSYMGSLSPGKSQSNAFNYMLNYSSVLSVDNTYY
ncbi:11185_t:CDS:2, partial [Acaulospora colombiana]